MIPVIMPDLQSDSAQHVVSAWFISTDDNVVQGDRLVEILLPGMTVDIPAPVTGRLASIEKRERAAVTTDEILGWIEPDADQTEDYQSS